MNGQLRLQLEQALSKTGARVAVETQVAEADGEIIRCNGVDPDFLSHVDGFVAGLPQQVSRIVESVRSQDVETLRQTLHGIKGSAGMFGFPQITAGAASAESRVKEGGVALAAAEVLALVELICRVEGFDDLKVAPIDRESGDVPNTGC